MWWEWWSKQEGKFSSSLWLKNTQVQHRGKGTSPAKSQVYMWNAPLEPSLSSHLNHASPGRGYREYPGWGRQHQRVKDNEETHSWGSSASCQPRKTLAFSSLCTSACPKSPASRGGGARTVPTLQLIEELSPLQLNLPGNLHHTSHKTPTFQSAKHPHFWVQIPKGSECKTHCGPFGGPPGLDCQAYSSLVLDLQGFGVILSPAPQVRGEGPKGTLCAGRAECWATMKYIKDSYNSVAKETSNPT